MKLCGLFFLLLFKLCHFTALKLKHLKWLLRSKVSSGSLQLGVWPGYMRMLLQKVAEEIKHASMYSRLIY